MKPILSIVIATFNSEKKLSVVLKSIERQTFPREKFEILVVDGGSKDGTLEIARNFGCKIIKNPRVEPLYARYLGYIKSRGKYLMYIDHDEVIKSRYGISKKIHALTSNEKIKMIIFSGYQDPKGSSFVSKYINEFGDPFSFFMYRLSKNSKYFIETMKKRYPFYTERKNYMVFDFTDVKEYPMIELGTAGCILDLEFLKKGYPNVEVKYHLIPLLFYVIRDKYPYLAIAKNDVLVHYSSDNLSQYLKKIKWRVKNNIYHKDNVGLSGFTGREKFQSPLARIKKYLFLPYSYSIIFPFFDSVYLAITRGDPFYFLHVPLCLYTATLILFHQFLKLKGYNPALRSYDETTAVKI